MNEKNNINLKLNTLLNEVEPSFFGHNLKNIAVYEKLAAIQEQMNQLKTRLSIIQQ